MRNAGSGQTSSVRRLNLNPHHRTKPASPCPACPSFKAGPPEAPAQPGAHTRSFSVIYLSFICHLFVIYLPFFCHFSVISLSFFCHFSVERCL